MIVIERCGNHDYLQKPQMQGETVTMITVTRI